MLQDNRILDIFQKTKLLPNFQCQNSKPFLFGLGHLYFEILYYLVFRISNLVILAFLSISAFPKLFYPRKCQENQTFKYRLNRLCQNLIVCSVL